MVAGDGGLGAQLVGDKIAIGQRNFTVTKLLGEGGFSYVYLVKEHADGAAEAEGQQRRGSGGGASSADKLQPLVLKVTSIHSRAQRDIAEKEAKLLSRLSHPSIIKMHDTCYRQVTQSAPSGKRGKDAAPQKERPQHLILMEYCEGGHALDVCSQLAASGSRFDLSTLIIAFGQICNAVSYLHAQRPPIVHRDLKPVNFLVKNGAYKLCDFGSAVFGHVDLRTQQARQEAEEVIEKTTTQMFRAPEMVDLYMAKKLTQATDVWALGCCLYSMAFLQNCFEEGSNLAILSGKYVIPDDNPYGDGLVELLERMLCSDSKARADMTEVILCLSAVYSGRPLPPRKKSSKPKKEKEEVKVETAEQPDTRAGTFRTDGQGVQEVVYDPTKATQAKKLDQNSAAARRKRAAAAAAAKPPPAPAPSSKASNDNKSSSDPIDFNVFDAKGDEAMTSAGFSDSKAFGEMKGFEDNGNASGKDFFGSFDNALMESKAGNASSDGFDAFDASAWASTDNNMDALTSGNAAEVTPPPPVTSSLDDAVPAAAVAPAGEPPDATASDHKRENSDSQRKHRSSRRRDQKHKSSSSSREPEVPSVEGLNIQEGEAGRKESEEAKKERRSRRTDRSKDDDEHRRRRSTSRKRRGGKTRDGREKQSEGESSEKKPVKRGTSFKGVFGRRQTPPEP